jgi:hypothetical protein
MKWISASALSTIMLLAIMVQACTKEYSCEGCSAAGNQPPVAHGGPTQLLSSPVDSTMLDGSASYDPDGFIVEYKWTKISGPATVTIVKADSARTWVRNLVAGNYQFELRVKDNQGAVGKDTVDIRYGTTGNQPPVACAGADQTITLPLNSAVLDGSCSSDPDVNITGYAWTQIAGPLSATIATPDAVSTNVNNLSSGIYQFQLKVTDAAGLFSFDTVQVTIKGSVDVYVAGFENGVAVYWKNGQAVPLPSNGIAYASSIFVVGNDVYVAGAELGSQNVAVRAMYWKNGQPFYLTGPTLAEANAITVSGNDVYVAGKEFGVAKYWKNGQAVALTNGQFDAEARDILVIGNDIYLTGSEVNPNSTRNARYWKNGIVDSLVNSVSGSSLAVAGTDVYIAGWGVSSSLEYEAKYWKNGQEVKLTIEQPNSGGHSIAFHNGDVYVAGWDFWKAKYWKNGQGISLTTGQSFATATSIKIFEGDVYVAGTESGSNNNYIATYWKNGQAVPLSNGANPSSALGIFVTH